MEDFLEKRYGKIFENYEVDYIYANHGGSREKIYNFIKTHKYFNEIRPAAENDVFIDILSKDVVLEVRKTAGDSIWIFEHQRYELFCRVLIVRFPLDGETFKEVRPVFCNIGLINIQEILNQTI